MAEENTEIVRRALTASTAQPPDLATVNALYHRDHVLTSDWGADGKTLHGMEGFAEVREDLDEAWEDWRQEIDDVIDAGGDRVVVLVRLKARGRESGAPVDQPWAMVVELRDGRIAASHTYLSREAALEAVGLAD